MRPISLIVECAQTMTTALKDWQTTFEPGQHPMYVLLIKDLCVQAMPFLSIGAMASYFEGTGKTNDDIAATALDALFDGLVGLCIADLRWPALNEYIHSEGNWPRPSDAILDSIPGTAYNALFDFACEAVEKLYREVIYPVAQNTRYEVLDMHLLDKPTLRYKAVLSVQQTVLAI